MKCYDNEGKLKPGFPKRNPKPFNDGEDVNNDGKKDRLGSSMKDSKGNAIECWCLQKSDKTSQQFAYAFVPADGSGRKWFGGCYFPWGLNSLKCEGEVIKEGSMKGMIKEYTKVTQSNTDRGTGPSMPPTGTMDKHFCYFNSGPNKGKTQKILTEGMWKPVAGGKYQYMTMKSTPCPVQDPPKNPQDLLASVFGIDPNDADAIAALGDFGGFDQPAAVLIADARKRPQLEYRLMVPPTISFSDGDTPARTLEAMEAAIHAGDELTITGSGVEGAFVAGDAATLDRGGWELVETGPEHATFRATTTVRLEPGVPFGPFVVLSEALPGPVMWTYMGRDIAMSASTGMPETGIKPNPNPVPIPRMENSRQ